MPGAAMAAAGQSKAGGAKSWPVALTKTILHGLSPAFPSQIDRNPTGNEHAPLPLPHLWRAPRERHRQGGPAVRLGPSHPRPRRRAVHRPARPLRVDPGGRRSRQPGVQDRRDAALGMGGADRRQGAAAAGRHRESRTADRRGRDLHQRDRGAGPGRRTADAGVRRSGISRGNAAQVPLPRPAPRPAASNIITRGADHRIRSAAA